MSLETSQNKLEEIDQESKEWNESEKFGFEFKAKIVIGVRECEGCFISMCRALDLFSYGDTKEEALKSLKETIDLYFKECFKYDTE